MATTRRTTKKKTAKQIVDNADKFSKPTFLVNCLQYCPNCTKLYPKLTDSFKKWLAGKGYDLYVNKDDAKSTYNFNKYGRPNGVRSTTPQLYVINGDKVAGISPTTDKWTVESLKELVHGLINKIK